METRARPTSRGRARCVSVRMGRRWEQTAAGPRAGACRLRRVGRRCLAPVGKGCCRCACSTLFALRAKALQSWRSGFWRVAGKNRVSERFAHQGTFPARRGTGERISPRKGRSFSRTPSPYALTMSLSPQETEIRPISPSKHVLPPTKPSTFIHPWQTRPVTSRVSSPPHFAANIRRASNPSFPPFPSPPHPPTIPRGERRALPAPAQGSRPLRIPFGERPTFSPVSRPPKRRRRQAPARGPAAVYSHHRPIRNETKQVRPLLMGRTCVTHAPKALAGDTVAYITWRSMHFKYFVSGAAGRMG